MRPAPIAPRTADASAAAPQRDATLTGLEVREALRSPAFYLLILAQGAGGAATTAWITFNIPHLQSAGFSLQATGSIVLAYGICQIGCRFAAGYIGDRFGRRRMYATGMGLMGLGMVMLAFVSPARIWLVPVVIAVFGLGNAGTIIGSSTMAADYFGTKRFATIRGLMSSLLVPVGITIPIFVGWMVDRSGSYQTSMVILGAVTVSGALWLLLIRRPLWDNAPRGAELA